MGNAELSRSPSLTKTIIIAGSGALGAVVLLAGLAVVPQSATAPPTYAQKEHVDCEYCHVNPADGGVRNAIGKQYEANGHTFKE
jgi:hypothetical protein